jgi:hypothetical protein
VLSDASTVLHHGPAALQLLSDRQLFQQQLLGLMREIQVGLRVRWWATWHSPLTQLPLS